MSVYALPALIALLSKVWVYILAKDTKRSSKVLLWLLVVFAAHNLSEVLVISRLFDGAVSESLLRIYYVVALFAFAYMCIFATDVAKILNHKYFHCLFLVLAAIVSVITMFSDHIVAGAVSVGYTVTAVRGGYYGVFQIAAITTFIFVIVVLGKRYKDSYDIHEQLRCFYALFSLSPVILIVLLATTAMQLGFTFTGAMLFPFASTLFLLLVVASEKDHDLISVRYRLPFSAGRKMEKEIQRVVRTHLQNQCELQDTKCKIERLLIQNALDTNHDNVSLAAQKLGLKRSSLYSKFARLGIKRSAN